MFSVKALVLLLLFSIDCVNSLDLRTTEESKWLSLKTERPISTRYKGRSLVRRTNGDAVSIHVDANHMFAWTPVTLGG